ncbi:MAG: hypothetical protein ACRC1I_05525 [Pseudomonas proteolytica]|uniref:hypothetical protein n=1 Tax=Pseudomonas proteolytica TaxID=219574 RepID=UPI003F30BFB9
MTDAEKATFFEACRLAEKITADTELLAEIEYSPNYSWKVDAWWFPRDGAAVLKSVGNARGFGNIVPYLETIYQFAPRKAAGA